jgi:outer membrane receptor protein involved in Fe transport
MTANNQVARAVRRAILLGACAATTTVAPLAAAQGSDRLEEVIITGSRIVAPNLEAISPVTAISAEDLAVAGKSRIEDILNQLPQVFAAQGAGVSNGSDGTASVDLRGLGVNRTLVLVNGRRLMPGDPDGGSAADLNQIPLALVKRVDVLTGGASSVYGADAVSGVVNFILDTEFEGVRVDANYSFFQHKNDNPVGAIPRARGFAMPDSNVTTGYAKDVSFALGLSGLDGRGHASFYLGYRDIDAVLQAEYDYSACTLNNTATGFACGGSATTAPANFLVFDPNFDNALSGPCAGGAFCIVDSTTGLLRPFAAADQFNFGPYNFHQRPDTRYTAGSIASFDVNDKATVYGELMYMENRTDAQIAPSGAFGVNVPIYCGNPFWNANLFQNFCGQFGLTATDFNPGIFVLRRNVEGGGRNDDIGHESIRFVAGVRGQLTEQWSYDAYYQSGKTFRNSTYENDFSITRLARALNAASGSSGPVCQVNADADPTNDDPNCVPWNIWQANGVTPAALSYLQTPGFQRAVARQQVTHIDFSGDLGSLVKLPTATSGLALNVGAEYRDEQTEFTVDEAFRTGDLAGQGGATLPVAGGFDVKEAFIEARLPLVEDRSFAKSISLETGYRFSDYSQGFSTDTYKIGLDWQPVEQLRLRGSYNRAVRVANVGELFSTQSVALDGSTDPCAGPTPAFSLAQCALTGVTPAQYGNIVENPAAQYNGLLGGNPNLQPETADTYTFGLVWRPQFADLSVAVDYFNIKIEETISSTVGGNADIYINQCLTTGDPRFCSLIVRDQTGSLWLTPNGYIIDTSLNLGVLRTKGIDVQANYALALGDHKLDFSLVGTYLDELFAEPVLGAGSYDCAGLYGNTCGTANPKWRHSLRTNWRTPWAGLEMSLTWRHFDSVDSERTDSSPLLAGTLSVLDRTLGSRDYLDLGASMTFAEKYTARIAVNNVLDKDPPIVGSGSARGNCPTGPCNGNTFPVTYDALGRQIVLSVRADF